MAQLLQAEDGTGTRRNVGATTSAGDGAVRVSAPDTDSAIAGVRDATDNASSSLGAKLDAIKGELVSKLNAAALSFVSGALKVFVANWPADFPDTAAQAILGQIRDKLNGGLTIAPGGGEQPVSDAATHAGLAAVAAKDFATQATLATLGTEATLQKVRRGLTDYEVRLDYAGGASPKYVGQAAQATAVTATAWTVKKIDYDASGNAVRVQVLNGVAWGPNTAARDGLGWS